ncbi:MULTISPECIES: hypothetical protein [unclassified Gilliamella]|uniref:hypothetical protein n=1 Tax=unclassified Gilliamella TaxID=2685620 RepID=UPI00080E76CD|nr:hypothetical protein [Gilliamella apicola]OCG33642.1 hypothetical protein A9G32_11410 [Gilliamella apicola]OCG51775.1 hypothetical protein A9G27_11555 [Gilliamella apicola]
MFLEEFLIKIGVDASKAGEITKVVNNLQAGANQLADTANSIQEDANKAIRETKKSTAEAGKAASQTKSKLFSLKMILVALAATAVLYGKKLIGAFNNAIDKAKELAAKKSALFKISQKELKQAELYKREMSKTGLALDSVKTKIALNLAPALTNLIAGFRNWLTVNKELIADGITKVIKAVGMAIQVVVNFVKFIDKIISGTIGWKNALIALGIAWAVLNRAFLFSPLGIILGLLTALMLLIDDLMVYMNGGKSLFGEYWQPFIDGAKAAWEFAKTFWEFIKALWSGDTQKVKSLSKSLFDSIVSGFKSIISGIKSLLSKAFKSILMFFGMSESEASKTVDRVGKIFNFIIDVLTLPFRSAYNTICQIMDWLGVDAGDSVNAIGETFKAIIELLVAPFKAAWKFINDLFDIWEDDTTTTTEKLGETLWAIFDFVISPFEAAWNLVKGLFKAWVGDVGDTTKKFAETFLKVHESITAPFKKAMDWIKDKFYGFIDSVKSKVKGALSWIGLGGDDDEIEVTAKRLTNTNIQAKLSTDGAKAGSLMPSNKNINNNNAVTINNTMNVTTPQEGFDNVYNIVDNTARRINDNTQTALGSN